MTVGVIDLYSVDRGIRMKKGLVTVKKAAEMLSVSIQTIIRWDNNGKLKAVRHPMNNYRLYRLVELTNTANKIGGRQQKSTKINTLQHKTAQTNPPIPTKPNQLKGTKESEKEQE